MPAQRRLDIMGIFRHHEAVWIDELAERFGVSRETIRRDLILLENQGVVTRVHGGGIKPQVASQEPPFEERIEYRADEKRAMAQLAVEHIGRAKTIFLDIGTSVAEVAAHLPDTFAGQVITNSVLAATKLARRQDINVMLTGGQMRHGDLALSGPLAEQLLRDIFVEVAFLGSGGVHPVHGLTDFYPDEIALRRILIDQHARSTYVMADSSKIGRVATQRVCPLKDLTGVITDNEADPRHQEAIRSLGVEVHIAQVDGQA